MSAIVRDLFNNVLNHFFANLPAKSYQFQCDEVSSKYEIRLNSGNDFMHCHKYPNKFDAFFVSSKSKNTIACLMIKPFEPDSAHCRPTILFSHGGTVDLGNLCNFLFTLGQRLCCNVFVYDYSGFGQSSGTPTEKAVYADAETTIGILKEKYGVPPENVVLYGQSMGTAPTLHLASMFHVKGVILHSPFLSAAKVYFPRAHAGNCRFYDFYKNTELIDKTDALILILHGTKDRVVPIYHAKELLKSVRNATSPLWVEGGGHDDLYTFDGYMKRLKRFVEFDVAQKH